MTKIFSMAILFMAALLGGCQGTESSAQSKEVRVTLPVDVFEHKLAATPNPQLIDVRTADEFEDGHLPNAVNMNVNREDYKQMFGTLDKTRPVFVYCKAGSRSADASKIMQEMGFVKVYNMDGGIMKWDAAGKSIVQGKTPPKSAGMTMGEFNHLTGKPGYVLADFNAKWCAPCKKMLPMLESLTEKNKDKLSLLPIDADENKTLLKEKDIESIPYLELYKDGKLIWKHEGAVEEQDILANLR